MVVDPSLFTAPYDEGYCNGLGLSHEVLLITRPLRPGEHLDCPHFAVNQFFYKTSERIRQLPVLGKVFLPLKAIEHVWNLFLLHRLIKKWRPDLVHFMWTPIPFFDAHLVRRLRKKYPVVHTVHDTHLYNGSPSSKLQLLGSERILSLFHHLFVLTNNAKNTLVERGLSFQKISVIRHGPIQQRALEVPYTGPVDQRKTILQFGLIKPYKGHDLLLRAFARVNPQTRSGWRLLIAGNGNDLAQKLQSLAKDLAIENDVAWDVRYIPEPEVPTLLKVADAFAFPYREIDESGAFQLTLQSGKPIVASLIGTFKETLTHNHSGLLFSLDDVDDLTRHLERLMSDETLRDRLGANALAIASEVPEWKEVGALAADVYQKVRSDAESPSAANDVCKVLYGDTP